MPDNNYRNALLMSQKRSTYRKRFDFVLRTYSTLGVLVAILGAAYFLSTLLTFELSPNQRLALITSGVGVTLAAMSRLMIAWRREIENAQQERLQDYEARIAFLSAWDELEMLSRFVSGEAAVEGEQKPLREILSQLVQTAHLDVSDVYEIDQALKMRNMLAHGDTAAPLAVIANSTDLLRKLIDKIYSSTKNKSASNHRN